MLKRRDWHTASTRTASARSASARTALLCG